MSEPAKGAQLECGCYAVVGESTNRYGGRQTKWIKCDDHRVPMTRPSDESVAEHLADARHALQLAKQRRQEPSA